MRKIIFKSLWTAIALFSASIPVLAGQFETGPLQILRRSDGGDVSHLQCATLDDVETYSYSIHIVQPESLIPNGPEKTDSNCSFPMYVYGYWGNNFSNVIYISNPIYLSDFISDPGGELAFYPINIDIDYSLVPETICAMNDFILLNITLVLTYYDQEEGYLPYSSTCDIFSSNSLEGGSFYDNIIRRICCSYITETPIGGIASPSSSLELSNFDKQSPLFENPIEVTPPYPNPFQNSFMLRFNSFNTEDFSIKIFNKYGKLIKKNLISMKRNRHEFEILFPNVPPGVYFVEINPSSGLVGFPKTFRVILI